MWVPDSLWRLRGGNLRGVIVYIDTRLLVQDLLKLRSQSKSTKAGAKNTNGGLNRNTAPVVPRLSEVPWIFQLTPILLVQDQEVSGKLSPNLSFNFRSPSMREDLALGVLRRCPLNGIYKSNRIVTMSHLNSFFLHFMN